MLKGKVAVVTDSTSGIGLGIARALAVAGSDLMINGFGEAAADLLPYPQAGAGPDGRLCLLAPERVDIAGDEARAWAAFSASRDEASS
jgi:NAD(P)-dependent dehydrogenase (short-subunit alcohol dehydrogenase family)